MTTTVRAHFDGNVFVPDERVDIPAGTALRVSYERVVETSPTQPDAGETASPSIVDMLPLIRGLDSDVVREIFEDPENEMSVVPNGG
jgi:hypothetical protein